VTEGSDERAGMHVHRSGTGDPNSPMSEPTNGPTNDQIAARVRTSTLLFTNIFKLAGLAVFLNEAVIRSQARLPVLGICLFCLAGAQVSETVLLSIIDKFLGR
jgi:hypothetical protein